MTSITAETRPNNSQILRELEKICGGQPCSKRCLETLEKYPDFKNRIGILADEYPVNERGISPICKSCPAFGVAYIEALNETKDRLLKLRCEKLEK